MRTRLALSDAEREDVRRGAVARAREVAREVCAELHYRPAEALFTRIRDQRTSTVRQAVFARLIDEGWSSVLVGEALGRDHATVLYGLKAHTRRVAARARRLRLLEEARRPCRMVGDIRTREYPNMEAVTA